MTSTNEDRPYLLLTAALDSAAAPAAITRSHGDAYERALIAVGDRSIAGIDLIELSVPAPVFRALRQPLRVSDDAVGVYDVFPVNPLLQPSLRELTGRFLAAEALWTLDEQGLLSGVPLNLKLHVPNGWSTDPKAIHQGLVDADALALSDHALTTYKLIKAAWDLR